MDTTLRVPIGPSFSIQVYGNELFTDTVLLESAIDFIHQTSLEGVVPVCHLAGGYSPRIHQPRALPNILGGFCIRSFIFCPGWIWRGLPCGMPCYARSDTLSATSSSASSVSLVAGDFPTAQHAMVPAMGNGGITQHITPSDPR